MTIPNNFIKKVSDLDRRTSITEPSIIEDIMIKVLNSDSEEDFNKEHFWVICLDIRNRLKALHLVSLGTLTSSLVHPREVFRTAINDNAASIMVCHNHPSNDVNPSDDDIKISKRLTEAGRIIGIDLLDHIIICNNMNNDLNPLHYTSLKSKGLI
jgi:DNA repair protein RadC